MSGSAGARTRRTLLFFQVFGNRGGTIELARGASCGDGKSRRGLRRAQSVRPSAEGPDERSNFILTRGAAGAGRRNLGAAARDSSREPRGKYAY
jgi:hypothetical protein